jgi:hypothetical protein
MNFKGTIIIKRDDETKIDLNISNQEQIFITTLEMAI